MLQLQHYWKNSVKKGLRFLSGCSRRAGGGFVPWEREAVRRIAQLPPLKQCSKSVLQKETEVCEGWGSGGRKLLSKNSPLLFNSLHRSAEEEFFPGPSTGPSRMVIFMSRIFILRSPQSCSLLSTYVRFINPYIKFPLRKSTKCCM